MLALPLLECQRSGDKEALPGVKNALSEKFHALWLSAFHDRNFPCAGGRGQTTSFASRHRFRRSGVLCSDGDGWAEGRSGTAFFLAIGVLLCHVTYTLFSHPESISWPIAFSPSAKSLMASTLFFPMSGACCTMVSALSRMRRLRCTKRARPARRWCSSPIRRVPPPASSPSFACSACLTRPMIVSSPPATLPVA